MQQIREVSVIVDDGGVTIRFYEGGIKADEVRVDELENLDWHGLVPAASRVTVHDHR